MTPHVLTPPLPSPPPHAHALKVAKGHAAGLTVGWYTNNIECNAQERGWSTTPALHQKHYEGVAVFLTWT